MMIRKSIQALGLVAMVWLGCEATRPADDVSSLATIEVYKTPTCGCCIKWIESLEAEGFEVVATNLPDLSALKAEKGVPGDLSACHTALVDGYVIEGHVPAAEIIRLLEERPAVVGLVVPGMPMGSPDMEHPDPKRHEAYEVLAFGPDGTNVVARYTP